MLKTAIKWSSVIFYGLKILLIFLIGKPQIIYRCAPLCNKYDNSLKLPTSKIEPLSLFLSFQKSQCILLRLLAAFFVRVFLELAPDRTATYTVYRLRIPLALVYARFQLQLCTPLFRPFPDTVVRHVFLPAWANVFSSFLRWRVPEECSCSPSARLPTAVVLRKSNRLARKNRGQTMVALPPASRFLRWNVRAIIAFPSAFNHEEALNWHVWRFNHCRVTLWSSQFNVRHGVREIITRRVKRQISGK